MRKIKVLFVCIHNSARSQIAEAVLNNLAGDRFEASSAGLSPGVLNPLAIDVMKEWGIDISQNETKSAFQMYKAGSLFDFVITVCDESSAEQCPIFPGIVKRLHWSFEDPSKFEGSHEEQIARTRRLRDAIRARLEEWMEAVKGDFGM